MKSVIFLFAKAALVAAADDASASLESYGPHCFSETAVYGTTIAGASETKSSDKTKLDDIAQVEYSNDARVTAIKYCVDLRTNYLNSVQAGFSNGFGSKITWMSTIGFDDVTLGARVVCSTYEVERDDYRVAEVEIGTLSSGVTWLNFVVRDVRHRSASPEDVHISMGKADSSLTFTTNKLYFVPETSAFTGFSGTTTTRSSANAVFNLGAVTFACWSDLNAQEKDFKDNLSSFYEEYEGLCWLMFAGVLLILSGCVICCLWGNDSM